MTREDIEATVKRLLSAEQERGLGRSQSAHPCMLTSRAARKQLVCLAPWTVVYLKVIQANTALERPMVLDIRDGPNSGKKDVESKMKHFHNLRAVRSRV